MPVLQTASPAGIQTLQQVANSFKTLPELTPLMGTSGWTQEPTISIANDVFQRILAQDMDWKWNRAYAPAFLTNGLQQDYVTNVSDMGWVENAAMLDINNTGFPKPEWSMEAAGDLKRTSRQGTPFKIGWTPNSLAVMGTWLPNTVYACPYGVAQSPNCPITQFLDTNGNILFIDSTILKLNVDSPGYNGGLAIVSALPNFPYGTSGATQPAADPNSPAGALVQDGSVIWTVANPAGIAFRLDPIPNLGGLTYLLMPVYQRRAPVLISLQQTIAPIPSDYAYLFRQGFLAIAYDYAGSKKAASSYVKWEESLMTALRAADRETNDNTMYPSESLTGGRGYGGGSIGPANPYGWF